MQCTILGSIKPTFFSLNRNLLSGNANSYVYSVFSTNFTDVGIWTIKCKASLLKYPTIVPIEKVLTVTITAPLTASLFADCIGSSDPVSCKMFVGSNPPYFKDYPDSIN